MTATATFSSPLTGIYTTAHAIDRAWGLTAFVAFRVAKREGISFEEALVRLPAEMEKIRFCEYITEMDVFRDDAALDFDILERYNKPILRGDVSYKLPSATSVEFWKQGWVLSTGKNVVCLAPVADSVFAKSVMQVLTCLTVNNGYGRALWGGYLRDKLPRAFAWASRLANFYEDGRTSEERFDYWHHQLVDTARVGFLALAKGVVFADVKPYDDFRGAKGGLAPYLEMFCKAFPAIAEKLKVRERNLSRIETLFTLPGYLVALYAIGDHEKVEEKYEMWRQAFHLGEKVIQRRKQIATETVVELEKDKNFFGLDYVPGGVGLYIETDEHIGKELWRFFRSTPDGEDWSPLQETFCDMLALHIPDVLDGERLDEEKKKQYATMATLQMSSEPKAVIGFVHKHVADETIVESLERLVALHNLKPAVMVLRKSVGHYIVLSNGHLPMKIDLRKAAEYLQKVEPGIWHAEGREISDRFELHMVMSGSSMLQDRPPSQLTAAQVKKILRLMVGVITH